MGQGHTHNLIKTVILESLKLFSRECTFKTSGDVLEKTQGKKSTSPILKVKIG